MEQFDLFDKYRIPTGKVMERDTKEPENMYRQVIHVIIFNSNGEMLIQQRQSTKKSWANMWDISIGGGVVAGEKPDDAAQRELSEELGISFDFSKIRPSFTSNFNNGFDDYYIINMDLDISTLKLQESEVQAASWASLEEIQELIGENKFIPYRKGLIQLLFNLKDSHYGALDD